MKKISVILLIAGLIWTVQTAQAQVQDTTKNSIEVKKKVRQGAHGRTITKVKVTGTGTPDAINGAADGAVTGHLRPAPTPAPIVITTPAPPAPEPTVVVLHDTVQTPAPPPVIIETPAHKSTEVTTTTTETKPVTANVTTHHVVYKSAYHRPTHIYHMVYKKTTATTTPATKTTTTTTVKKTE